MTIRAFHLLGWLLCLALPGCGQGGGNTPLGSPVGRAQVTDSLALADTLERIRHNPQDLFDFFIVAPIEDVRSQNPDLPRQFTPEVRYRLIATPETRARFQLKAGNLLEYTDGNTTLRMVRYEQTPTRAVLGLEVEERTDSCTYYAAEVFYNDYNEWKRVSGDLFPSAQPESLLPADADRTQIGLNLLQFGDIQRRLLPDGAEYFFPCTYIKGPHSELPPGIEPQTLRLRYVPDGGFILPNSANP